VQSIPGYQLTVDLSEQIITLDNGDTVNFEINPFKKHCLLNGLDDIDLTLQHADDIEAYEQQRKKQAPWLFS
jgi:3-isopropylmalate/(R)-2-methylmalate dehydratase small subunit